MAGDTGYEDERERNNVRLEGLRGTLRDLEAWVEDIAGAVPVTVLAVGLVVLLATTWLVPTTAYEDPGDAFGRASTGLGLLNGPWQSTEAAAHLVAGVGVVVYIVAAAVVLIAARSRSLVGVIAACAGLAATATVLVAKPGPVEGYEGEVEWEYAWQAAPYLACAFWMVLIVMTAIRRADGNSRS